MSSLDGGPPAAAVFRDSELSTATAECMGAPQKAATRRRYVTPLAMLLNCAYRNQLNARHSLYILNLFFPRLNGKLPPHLWSASDTTQPTHS